MRKIIYYIFVLSLFSCGQNITRYESEENEIDSNRKFLNNYLNDLKNSNNDEAIINLMKANFIDFTKINDYALAANFTNEKELSFELKSRNEYKILFNEEINEWMGEHGGYYDSVQCDCNAMIISIPKKTNIGEYCLINGKIYSSAGIYDFKTDKVHWIRELYTKEELDSLGIEGK